MNDDEPPLELVVLAVISPSFFVVVVLCDIFHFVFFTLFFSFFEVERLYVRRIPSSVAVVGMMRGGGGAASSRRVLVVVPLLPAVEGDME